MKKLILYGALLAIAGWFLSCNGLRIEKRRYLKGYFISSRHSHGSEPQLIEEKPDIVFASIDSGTHALAMKSIPDSLSVVHRNEEPVLLPADVASGIQPEAQAESRPGDGDQALVQNQTVSYSGEENNWFNAWTAAGFALCLAGLGFGILHWRLARRLSAWASRKPTHAVALITVIRVGLIAMGAAWGMKLADWGVEIPHVFAKVFCIATMTAAIFYPFRSKNEFVLPRAFAKKKTIELLIASSMVIASGHFANQYRMISADVPTGIAITEIACGTASELPRNKSITPDPDPKKPKKQKDGKGKAIGLTILVILGIIAAGLVMAVIVCGIYCFVAEVLAYVVGVAGGVGLIILAVTSIRNIWREYKESLPPPKPTG